MVAGRAHHYRRAKIDASGRALTSGAALPAESACVSTRAPPKQVIIFSTNYCLGRAGARPGSWRRRAPTRIQMGARARWCPWAARIKMRAVGLSRARRS